MSVIIDKEMSIFFSSDEKNGAENVSSDGSSFQVSLNKPLSIPSAAVQCKMGITQASIWNTSANISPEFGNNIFSFITTDVSNINQGGPITTNINIPEGLYSVIGLNTYMGTQFKNLGFPTNLITISGDDATQSIILTFLEAGTQVDFTVGGSCREVLGFNARLSPEIPQAAGYSDYGDNEAAFNRTNSYLIRSDIVSYGIPINNKAANIIAQIPITAAPGSQINYQPTNILWCDASELIGQTRLNLSFVLNNQSLQPTPTSGDNWSFILTIAYSILLTDQPLPLNPSQ